jgi:hypothetical protein
MLSFHVEVARLGKHVESCTQRITSNKRTKYFERKWFQNYLYTSFKWEFIIYNSIRNSLQSLSLVEFVSHIRIDLHVYETTTPRANIYLIHCVMLAQSDNFIPLLLASPTLPIGHALMRWFLIAKTAANKKYCLSVPLRNIKTVSIMT